MSSLRFTEHLAGFISATERDYNQAWLDGKRNGTACAFDVDIVVDDVDRLLDDPDHVARLTGRLDCEMFGGRIDVVQGTFNLFVEEADRRKTTMRYRLFLADDQ